MDTAKLWLLVPIVGALALLVLDHEEKHIAPSKGKEKYYLTFNKDEIMKNLLATEEHFRNIEAVGVDTKGFQNCCVKHLASSESHADEAQSHSLIVEGAKSSKQFAKLRDGTRQFRHDVQAGRVTPEEGIERSRQLRRQFEQFNPEFDVSKCKACEIHTSMAN